MIPFRVFDEEKKEMWIVLNYHPNGKDGQYLIARDNDSDVDGEIRMIESKQLTHFKLVDFVEEWD